MKTQSKRRCEICNVDVHKSSYAKHLRTKMHEDNQRLFHANFFNESELKLKTIVKPKKIESLKELSMNKLQLYKNPVKLILK